MVSFSVSGKQLLCFMHGQGLKKANKSMQKIKEHCQVLQPFLSVTMLKQALTFSEVRSPLIFQREKKHSLSDY